MQEHRADDRARSSSRETGKSLKDATGETDAAIEMGFFVAGEGRRFYGRTTTSAVPNKAAMTIRQPLGVAGLIIAANTPIANVAWKAFPALLCGNAAIMKASEDTPRHRLGVRRARAGGRRAGRRLQHRPRLRRGGRRAARRAPRTSRSSASPGSCEVGRWIAATCGRRLAKVCLELGGKNPFIVCDDADLDLAVQWALGSAFSNAGQRCASGSRMLVFDAVYDEFKRDAGRGGRQR